MKITSFRPHAHARSGGGRGAELGAHKFVRFLSPASTFAALQQSEVRALIGCVVHRLRIGCHACGIGVLLPREWFLHTCFVWQVTIVSLG